MTDELRYERLALSIGRTHSIVPRIHGVDNHSYAQLYPLLIAPIFAHGYVPHDLHLAHLLNAWLMTSACIPAFILARRVNARRWAAYLVAVISVFVPWMIYSTMLMTEVAAYPAFIWAALATQTAIVEPSKRNDLLVVLALALSFFARTALFVLVVVPPVSIVAFELARASGGRVCAVMRSVRRHALLSAAFILLLAGMIVLEVKGNVSSIFGVYGGYATSQSPFGRGSAGSFVAHIATFSLGIGVLPFVVGTAWLLANVVKPSPNPERHAFACIGSVTVAAIAYQSSSLDLRYFNFVHDRYMLYLAPLLVLATLCAVTDQQSPRWSLILPGTLVTLGFLFGAVQKIDLQPAVAVDPEDPAASFYRPLLRITHGLGSTRALLAVITVVSVGLFAYASLRFRRSIVTTGIAALLLIVLPTETSYAFTRLFWINGWSNRPLTADMNGVYDWVDRAVGTTADVTMIPYPVSSDFFVSERAWWDYEFWNKSVDHDVHYPYSDVFESTGIWFPKTYIDFNRTNGAASVTLSQYVLASDQETRFRISGTVQIENGGVRLIRAPVPWRADWMMFGLYEDGWTKPGVTARVRVFATPGEKMAHTRSLSLAFRGLGGVPPKPVTAISNAEAWHGTASSSTIRTHLLVCVPAHGFTEVHVSAPGESIIPPNLRSADSWNTPGRRGGVLITEVALADEIGPPCKPMKPQR